MPEVPALERALEASVYVFAPQGGPLGAGVVVDARGLVLTARHVVTHQGTSRRRVEVLVRAEQPDETKLEGQVFSSHAKLDCALLWVTAERPLETIAMGEPRAVRHGQTVFAVGAPAGNVNSVSRGVVSKPRHMERGVEWIQTDAAIDPGNSGGPLVDDAGRLLGINVWGRPGFDTLHFALPADYLGGLIERASQLGPQACIASTYCTLCGHWASDEPACWYCRNCGATHTRLSS